MFYRRECFLEVLFHSQLLTLRCYMGVLEDHDCDSTLSWFNLKCHDCGKRGWVSADRERWIMGR